MTPAEISHITSERLKKYGVFSDGTVKAIAQLAETQAAFDTYQDFFASVGMTEIFIHKTKQGRGVPVIDIAPRKPGGSEVLVLHLPMNNSLDENQRYHIASIASVLPTFRIIAFGNPSGAPYNFKEQNLRLKDLVAIARARRLETLIAAEFDYLAAQQLNHVYHVGYSYGAMKATIMAGYSASGSVKVLLAIDPVAHPRYRKQLLENFQTTLQPLGAYVERTHLEPFFKARLDAAKHVRYNAGLLRPINIAIGLMLARIDFITLLKKALYAQPLANMTVAWATKSELGNDAHIKTSLHELRHQNPGRVTAVALKDDVHAVANDVHVHMALIYQAVCS